MTKKINGLSVIAFFAMMGIIRAQGADEAMGAKDTTSATKKIKLDGIAAVVGDYVIAVFWASLWRIGSMHTKLYRIVCWSPMIW